MDRLQRSGGKRYKLPEKRKVGSDRLLVIFSFTRAPRVGYPVGVPEGGFWREVLNSDAGEYGGGGFGNFGGLEAAAEPCHYREHSLLITIPPLGMVVFKK